jgi:hypothetical protein
MSYWDMDRPGGRRRRFHRRHRRRRKSRCCHKASRLGEKKHNHEKGGINTFVSSNETQHTHRGGTRLPVDKHVSCASLHSSAHTAFPRQGSPVWFWHRPSKHVSFPLQNKPSLHGSVLNVFEQLPFTHRSVVHGFESKQSAWRTQLTQMKSPRHCPELRHRSLPVHGLPSEQFCPMAGTCAQLPSATQRSSVQLFPSESQGWPTGTTHVPAEHD